MALLWGQLESPPCVDRRWFGSPCPQLQDFPVQETLWRLGHVFHPLNLWDRDYQQKSNNYTRTFSKYHSDSSLVCTTHPYVFLMGPSLQIT